MFMIYVGKLENTESRFETFYQFALSSRFNGLYYVDYLPTYYYLSSTVPYGMMASFNFLLLFIQVHNIHIPAKRKIFVYCDNLSLVNCVNNIMSGNTYPRMYIRSEADVILQIAFDIQQLQDVSLDVIVAHVKGHQDDHNPYQDLPREAQLNVDADIYATNFLIEGIIPPYDELPANPMNFYINDIVITRDIKNEVRKASRSPELQIYMIDKFDWKDYVPDTIWWIIHGSTIRSLSGTHRQQIQKYIFGWLPTCVHLKLQDNDLSDICPSCKTIETHDHNYKCQCDSRIVIKNKWFETFDKFLANDRYTPPIIRQLFFNHIAHACTSRQLPPIPPLPRNIELAIKDQDAIGWKQLLSGRLAFRWGTIIADHLHYHRISEKEMTPLIWGRKIIRQCFDLIISLWQQRNTDGHLLNSQKESQLTRARLLTRIEALQSRNPEVSYCHRDFIFKPIEQFESYNANNLRSWLRAAEQIISFNKSRRQTTTNISQYFVPNQSNINRRSHKGTKQFTVPVPIVPDPNNNIEIALDPPVGEPMMMNFVSTILSNDEYASVSTLYVPRLRVIFFL